MIPWIPILPTMNELDYNEKPPTLYSIMNSIVNFGKPINGQSKIRNLAKESHSTIFDFDYPLSELINKEDFECMILNHFIKRRIGTETFTEFQINLQVRLNSIMPIYNKLFNALDRFGLGDVTERNGTNNKNSNTTNEVNTSTESQSNVISNQESIIDNRSSELPQNQLENLQNGSYASNATYSKQDNNNTSDSHDNSSSNQKQKANTTDDTKYNETETKTNSLEILQAELKNIYYRIFADLDDLFYQLV